MNWMDMTKEEITEELISIGQPTFRASQIFSWLHKDASFDEMTNLPSALREQLSQMRARGGARIVEKVNSKLNGTVKYLFALDDDNVVEGVLMRYKHGNTLCISSQIGCRMGCSFCASTMEGLIRNLTAGEMLGQVVAVEREIKSDSQKKSGRAVTNIVLMGSGEPFDNYDNLLRFLKLVNHPAGINVGIRNISVSTCGLPDKIVQIANDMPGVNLAISLHAPYDELRQTLMPIARAHSVDDVISAARRFVEITSRRVIFEYALILGVNDQTEHATALANLLRGLQCHVNVIPLNEVSELELRATNLNEAKRFCELLSRLNISATIRREMGDDIEGACGQLRRKYLKGG